MFFAFDTAVACAHLKVGRGRLRWDVPQEEDTSLTCVVERLCKALTSKAEAAEAALRAAQHQYDQVVLLSTTVSDNVQQRTWT